MEAVVQKNRGGGTMLTRRWVEGSVARSFSEDFRADRGTPTVETSWLCYSPQLRLLGIPPLDRRERKTHPLAHSRQDC